MAENQNWQANGSSNQNFVLIDCEEVKFYTKEEVANLWQVSIFTLQKWLGKMPPEKSQEKEDKNSQKKLYSEDYIKKLFQKFRPSLLEKSDKNLDNDKSLTSLYEEIIKTKDDQIRNLEGQNHYLKQDLANQRQANFESIERLTDQTERLTSQVSQWQANWKACFLDQERQKKLENEAKSSQNLVKNWVISFLALFKRNEGKEPPNDN